MSEAKAWKMSCSDCKVSEQVFRAFPNLTHHPSHGMRSTDREIGHVRPLVVGGWGVTTKFWPELLNIPYMEPFLKKKGNEWSYELWGD